MSAIRKFWLSLMAYRTETLWHPDSPGMRVTVTRSRFGRLFKPTDFATLTEAINAAMGKEAG